MYRLFEFARKFEYKKFRKFNEKLCTLDVWIIWICRKFEFWRYVECTKLRKLNEKVCTELRKELAIMKGGLPFQVGPSLLYIPDQVGPNAHSWNDSIGTCASV